MKLRIGGSNIKAVQGDTGHSQSRMVTDLYAHINDEDRRILAKKLTNNSFRLHQKQKFLQQLTMLPSHLSCCRRTLILQNC